MATPPTPNPTATSTVLKSPSVWTNQYGVDNLDVYLDYPVIQNAAQQALMVGAFEGLINAGIILGTETPRFIATFLQPATLYGVNAVVDWVYGTADPATVTKCQIAARQAQFAIDLADQVFAEINEPPIVQPPIIVEPGGPVVPPVEPPVQPPVDETPTTDYTDRAIIDQVLQEIIGNSKIPTPAFATTPLEVNLPGRAEDGTFRFAPGNRGK
jgi:hypothetical protein